jgi:hypothetical protein
MCLLSSSPVGVVPPPRITSPPRASNPDCPLSTHSPPEEDKSATRLRAELNPLLQDPLWALRRRWLPQEHQQTRRKDRRVLGQRSPHPIHIQWLPEDDVRVELEACDQGAVQGKRIRVLIYSTLPKPSLMNGYLVVTFFLRGGFLPLTNPRRSMGQRDNRLS